MEWKRRKQKTRFSNIFHIFRLISKYYKWDNILLLRLNRQLQITNIFLSYYIIIINIILLSFSTIHIVLSIIPIALCQSEIGRILDACINTTKINKYNYNEYALMECKQLSPICYSIGNEIPFQLPAFYFFLCFLSKVIGFIYTHPLGYSSFIHESVEHCSGHCFVLPKRFIRIANVISFTDHHRTSYFSIVVCFWFCSAFRMLVEFP